MTATTETRRVFEDRLPARVRTPEGDPITEVCRVVLTRDELYVWADQDGQIRLVHRGPWAPERSSLARRGTWRVGTPAGHWTIERAGGCACDSPLKRFVPWTPYRVARR